MPLLENTLRVARAVGDEDLVALVRKEMGRARSRAGDVSAGLILLKEARAQLVRLREPQEVVDADIASAEAHLLAGRPEQALALIERALAEATSIHAATCCRLRIACKRLPCLRWVKSHKLARR